MKIKLNDNVDFSKLEKYLKYLPIKLDKYDENSEEIEAYCCVDEYDDIQFYFDKDGDIVHTNYPECRNETIIYCTLYDLAKEDLIKKVEE